MQCNISMIVIKVADKSPTHRICNETLIFDKSNFNDLSSIKTSCLSSECVESLCCCNLIVDVYSPVYQRSTMPHCTKFWTLCEKLCMCDNGFRTNIKQIFI